MLLKHMQLIIMLRTHINAEHPNAIYLSVVCLNHKHYMWSGYHGVLKGWCQGHCQSIRMLNCLQGSSQYQLTKFITVIDALHISIAQIPLNTHKSVCVHGMYWVLTKAHITLTYYMPKVLEGIHLISLHVSFGSSCLSNQTPCRLQHNMVSGTGGSYTLAVQREV